MNFIINIIMDFIYLLVNDGDRKIKNKMCIYFIFSYYTIEY